jgi:hypothetical protein
MKTLVHLSLCLIMSIVNGGIHLKMSGHSGPRSQKASCISFLPFAWYTGKDETV